MEWFDGNIAWWHWVVLGLLLVAAEVFVASFVLIWFGLAAILVGVAAALLPLSFTAELFVWILLSVASVVVWLRYISPRLKNRSLSGMAREAVLGQEGMVINTNAGARGRLRFPIPVLGSDEWPFICEQELQPGDRVRVKEFSGNTLVVQKI